MKSAIAICGIFIATMTVCADDAPAHLLGQIDFPNSGAPEAQADFIEGVLYMHNFEYAEAGAAFKRAQAIDPNFAMAYWGEAMSFHHSLWGRQSTSNARDVLNRLGKTCDDRAAKAPTEREKDYLRAAEILFGMAEPSRELPKHNRDVLYRDAMQAMHEKYPTDHEALAFYGLSILGAGSENRDYATYMKAAAVLTELWDANRLHPGAAHYLIHAYDDPVHAPLGLPMARAYSKIAPDAAHAQHMTSHIFVAMGMWEDLVAANETAVEVELQSAEATGATAESSHYLYWLEYGYLQQGRHKKAGELLKIAHDKLSNNPTQAQKLYYGAMFARYQLDGGTNIDQFVAPEGVEIVSPHYHFARAFATLQRGDVDASAEHAKHIQALDAGNPEVVLNPDVVAVMQKEIEAMTELARSQPEKAIALLREAAMASESLPIRYGPPQVTKPAYELLGEVLLQTGDPQGAVAAFEKQLESTPLRSSTLRGLVAAARASGDTTRAKNIWRQLSANWENADHLTSEIVHLDEASN